LVRQAGVELVVRGPCCWSLVLSFLLRRFCYFPFVWSVLFFLAVSGHLFATDPCLPTPPPAYSVDPMMLANAYASAARWIIISDVGTCKVLILKLCYVINYIIFDFL
jgi:hypothetical protein